jgi:hypothetical protein
LSIVAWTALLFLADPIPKEIVVESGNLKRFIQLQPVFRTTRILNTATGDELKPAADTPEFSVVDRNAMSLVTDDFIVEKFEGGRVTLRHRSDSSRRIVVHPPSLGGNVLDRRLKLEGFDDVARLDVELMKLEVRTEIGGLGQPLFLDGRWFMGLEHPAGNNEYVVNPGHVMLSHRPSTTESMTAVIGGLESKDDRLEDTFERRLAAIRARPPTPMIQFNTWYDVQGSDLTPANCKAAFDVLHRELLKPHGLKLHSFVIDDGWQNPQSLWEANAAWSDGLKELATTLKESNAGLGLWLPLNGASLDVDWGNAKGWPRTNHRKPCYCLASPDYQKALTERLKALKPDVAFFKHDFNYFTCSLDGHGHLPTSEHGREANVIGQIAVLDAVKSTNAVTSNAWPSPYWLKHTDYLWIGSYDYAEDWSVPCWSKRQAEMTFRDSVIHRLLRIDRAQVPMNALMTHGLIRGKLEGAAADRDINDWSDYVMMFLGRGVMLQELYLTPDLLGPEEWKILGSALAWANDRTETLKHTRMIGGRPDRGEPYGYVHWSEDMGIVCLRNPSPRPTEIVVTLDERPSTLPKHPVWEGLQIYPDRRRRPAMTSERGSRIKLNGHEVALVEFAVGKGEKSRADSSEHSPPMSVVKNEPDRLDWDFQAAFGDDADAEVVWWTEPGDGAVSSVVRDASVRPLSKQSDAGWSMHRGRYRSGEAVSMRLPFSPLWPQQPRVSAVLRMKRKDAQRQATAPPTGSQDSPPPPQGGRLKSAEGSGKVDARGKESTGRTLPEIRPSHRDGDITETLVLDEWRFSRRRSWPEKLGWLLALGAAPVAAVGGVSKRLGAKWQRPKTVSLIALAMLIGLYALTPLGAALGRVLGEF